MVIHIYKVNCIDGNDLIRLNIQKGGERQLKMGTIKTTITIDEDLWRKFSILVIQEKGYRKKKDVIEGLIKEFIQKEEMGQGGKKSE